MNEREQQNHRGGAESTEKHGQDARDTKITIGCQKPGDNPISRAIANHDGPGAGGERYCHAAIWFEANLVYEAHSDFGVRFREATPEPGRWTLWTLAVEPAQLAVMRRFCELHAGDGYDLSGVFAFKLGLFKQDPQKRFCSELVMETLYAGSAILCTALPHQVSPNRLSIILESLSTGRMPVIPNTKGGAA